MLRILRVCVFVVGISATARASEVQRAWLIQPYGTGWAPVEHVERVKAENRQDLLRRMADQRAAFVFVGSPSCGAAISARHAYIAVAASLFEQARFMEVDPQLYAHEYGEVSPSVLFFRDGKLVHEMRGVTYPDGGGSKQVRAKLIYEGFALANLFGIDVAADARVKARAQSLPTRPGKAWYYGFAPDGPVDFEGRDLRMMVSFNSDFRDANFVNADLRGARILFTDLRGARLKGAKLNQVKWSGSICPDGHRVVDEEDSCEAHLTGTRGSPPRRVTTRGVAPD